MVDGDSGVRGRGFSVVVVKGFKVLLELKWRVQLVDCKLSGDEGRFTRPTSAKGINGGPDAISAAFVPGRILRIAPLSSAVVSLFSGIIVLCSGLKPGDFGPICTSGKGGGLGRRGDLEGDTPPTAAAIAMGRKSRRYFLELKYSGLNDLISCPGGVE